MRTGTRQLSGAQGEVTMPGANDYAILPCTTRAKGGQHHCKGCKRVVHNLCLQAVYGIEGSTDGFWCAGTKCHHVEGVEDPSDVAGDNEGDSASEGEGAREEEGVGFGDPEDLDMIATGVSMRHGKEECAALTNCAQGPLDCLHATQCCGLPCHLVCASDCTHCPRGELCCGSWFFLHEKKRFEFIWNILKVYEISQAAERMLCTYNLASRCTETFPHWVRVMPHQIMGCTLGFVARLLATHTEGCEIYSRW